MKKNLILVCCLVAFVFGGFCFGNVGWDNDKFVDSDFWTLNPSDSDVIYALYGSKDDKTAYTLNRSGYDGNCSGMTVVETGILTDDIQENTIYILNTGGIEITGTINMENCSAIISKSGTIIYTKSKQTTGINLGNINYSIIDNIEMDGYSKIGGGSHTKSTNGITLDESSNTTINNFEAYDFAGAGIYALYDSNHNNVQNSKVYNSAYGIRFYSGGKYNVINNVMVFNFSSYGIQLQGSYNSVNNTQIFNGSSHGLSMYNYPGENNIVNNVQIYNIGQHALFGGENVNVKLHNIYSFNNKFYGINNDAIDGGGNIFYGDLKLFDNGGDSKHIAKYLVGDDEFSSIGWTKGVNTGGDTSWGMIANPKNVNGNYLLNWDSRFPLLQGNVPAFTGKVVEISFGNQIKTQEQPVYRNDNTVVTGWQYDENKFIGSDTEKFDGNLDLEFSNFDRQNVDVSAMTDINGIGSYSIYGNVLDYKENSNFGKTINLDLSRIGKNYIVGQIHTGDTFMHQQNIAFVDEYRNIECQNGWDNDKFLDETFWENNPSDENIICALYGKDENDITAYSQIWDSEYHDRCYGMQVVETGILPTNMTPNTIYVLTTGAVISAGTIWPKYCNAVISKDGTTMYSTKNINYIFHFYGDRYLILDNISIDGINDGIGGKHDRNSYGFVTHNPKYITFNDFDVYNSNYTMELDTTSNIYFNNVKLFNNNLGLNIWDTIEDSSFNNMQIFNNGDGFRLEGEYNVKNTVFNNLQIYNNTNTGLIMAGSDNYFHNIKLYNNGSAMDVQDSSNLKYYGNLEIFGNGDNTNYLEKGGDEYSNIGWNEGKLKTGEMTWNYVANPKDIEGNYMLDWTSDFESLRGQKDIFSGLVSGYSYGVKIFNQEVPVAVKGNSLVKWGNYSLDKYISSNLKGITGDIYLSGNKAFFQIGYPGDILIVGKSGDVIFSSLNEIIDLPIEIDNIIITKFGTGKNTYHYGSYAIPECWIEYDPYSETYENVLTKIICNNDVEITTNDGNDSYLFTKNGNFVFGYVDVLGNSGELIADVNWIKTKNSGDGGGGGTPSNKDICPNGDFSPSRYDGNCGIVDENSEENDDENQDYTGDKQNNPNYSQEMNDAYRFSYENNVTTMDSIEKADVNGGLTRISMAKMLSKYAINVLNQTPANIIVPDFKDISDSLDEEYDNGVTLAYQLGIMGINMPNNEFRPYDLVPRSEFVTALSRMMYNTPDGKDVYYSTHMKLLHELGIISVADPKMLEIRGYVMLMLMRSSLSI